MQTPPTVDAPPRGTPSIFKYVWPRLFWLYDGTRKDRTPPHASYWVSE